MRVAVIKNIVTPYSTQFFTELDAQLGGELLVVYESGTEPNRRWGSEVDGSYARVILNSKTITGGRVAPDSFLHIPRRPLSALKRFRPDVVVLSGGLWTSPLCWAVILGQGTHGWKVVPWWGEFRQRSPLSLGGATEPLRRRFVHSGDAWLAYSRRAADDAVRLGASASRTLVAGNVAISPKRAPPEARRPTGQNRCLFVGQLTDRKGIQDVVRAVERLPVARLRVAGDGPLRELVAEAAVRTGGRIEALGHLTADAVHHEMDQADVLVVPSHHEVWGLVINEAVAHGLPVVASSEVAGADHLIEDGISGAIFPAGDISALQRALTGVLRWSDEQYSRSAGVLHAAGDRYTFPAMARTVVRASRIAISP